MAVMPQREMSVSQVAGQSWGSHACVALDAADAQERAVSPPLEALMTESSAKSRRTRLRAERSLPRLPMLLPPFGH